MDQLTPGRFPRLDTEPVIYAVESLLICLFNSTCRPLGGLNTEAMEWVKGQLIPDVVIIAIHLSAVTWLVKPSNFLPSNDPKDLPVW